MAARPRDVHGRFVSTGRRRTRSGTKRKASGLASAVGFLILIALIGFIAAVVNDTGGVRDYLGDALSPYSSQVSGAVCAIALLLIGVLPLLFILWVATVGRDEDATVEDSRTTCPRCGWRSEGMRACPNCGARLTR